MKGTLARALEALHGRDFRFLLGARLAGQAGDGLFNATIVALVAFNPDQKTAVGVAEAFALLILPYSLIGPFVGVFIDRWSRRRILVWTPVLRAVVLLAASVASPGSPLFLVGALVAASVNRFFSATAGAVTPKLVPDEDLLMANSLASVGGTVTMSLFAFAGGLLADSVGTGPVVVLIAVAWLATALLARAISTDLSALHAPEMRLRRDLARVGGEFVDGIRRLSHSASALAPIASISWDQFLQGTVFVLSLVVFRERFREGVGSYSWMLAAGAAGLLLGIATVGILEDHMPKGRIVMLAFTVSGVGLLAATISVTRVTVLIQAFLVGFAYAWKKVPVDTMVQEAVPDDYRGRVFAVYDVTFNIGRVSATALAVWLIPTAGVTGTLLLCGAGFLLWVPLLRAWLARADRMAVRFYAGATADELPRAVVIFGDEVPVEALSSWHEERQGVRVLRFRVKTPEGLVLELSRPEAGGPWRLDA